MLSVYFQSFTAVSFGLKAALAVVLVIRLNIPDSADAEPAKPELKKLHMATLILFSLSVVSDVVVMALGIKGFSWR